MTENKHTKEFLKEMQALPLERKIQITIARITEWYQHFDGKVYVSFSGGKDSTVLLDIARKLFPDIEAVFVDTGLEYPEIREFVKTFDNVTWLRPEMVFKQVIEKYGYPALSKNISHNVSIAKRHPNGAIKKNIFDPNKKGQYALFKWSYLLEAPFNISDKCCDMMKKLPIKKYAKKIGKKSILGTMACESKMRTDKWLQNGCNSFDTAEHKSQPLSFWTEQDVLQYIKAFNIPHASVYGDLREKDGKLYFTDCQRTGCMFCMFGCHLEKSPNRFQRMAKTHPKQYDFCIRPVEENGLGLCKVLDFIGVDYKPIAEEK